MSVKTQLKILLAEDNMVNQLMAQGTLSHLGHEVDVASDGREALEKSRECEYHLVLMDLMMPVMDGFESARQIVEHARSQERKPPVIVALTATLTEEDKIKCRECGMLKWISKPIDPEEFESLAAEILPQDSFAEPAAAPDVPAAGTASVSLTARIKDPIALAKIVELFKQSYPERLQELKTALASSTARTARRAAHSLKGNFLNFDSAQGAAVAQEMEHAIVEAQWETARRLVPKLEHACDEVAQSLTELIRATPQSSPPKEERSRPDISIIVADVDPANRAICSAALQADGYDIVEASDGEQVLEILEARDDIDVVLMGVFMARLGGFETCRRIKSNDKTQVIPVLLVTALDERGARITGMDAGADDFITKPIDPREVSLRVRNAARGKELYDQLQTSFTELQRLEELRDGLTHMLVHDLRTPLTAIKGYASLLVAGFGAGMTPQQKTFAEKIVLQSNRLVDMVSAILDVSRLESDQMPLNTAKTDLSLLLFEQSEQFTGLPDCNLELDIADAVELKCDSDLIKRVVANLLSNAFKYTPKDKAVTLRLRREERFAVVEVLDKGPGVPDNAKDKIFEKFTQVEGETHKRPYSSGLGLTFCQLVVNKHGGEIAVDDADGGGARFWFTLPLAGSRAD